MGRSSVGVVALAAPNVEVLASGFSAATDKKGSASPGDAVAFAPSTSYTGHMRGGRQTFFRHSKSTP